MESNISTVGFQSNLFPVEKSYYSDKTFQSKIHDPFSLVALRNRHSLTPLQQQEYRRASLHCAFANADDYPWGTVLDESGNERVVCKCLNTKCKYFSSCRPDFDVSELAVYEANKLAQPTIFIIDESSQTRHLTENENDAVVAQLFADDTSPKDDPVPNTGNSEKVEKHVQDDPFVLRIPPAESVVQPVETGAVGFHSFIESSQDEIIKADVTERSVVNAGPGTGKTWTLIERAIHMINEGTAAENILALCFSRSAVEVVKTRLADAGDAGRAGYEWSDVDVLTFDSFATQMLVWVQDSYPELLPQQFLLETCDYDSRIQVATSVLKKNHEILAQYEHIIVDEMQDLVGCRAELVLAMLKGLPETCGFTVLGDSCQSLYDYVATDDPSIMTSTQFYEEIFKYFPNASYFSLTENHRQGDKLGELTIPYRRAILTGTLQERASAASSLLADISKFPGRLQTFSRGEAMRYTQQGTLGILTRTNGQALQISAWLRNEDVPHTLQRGIGASTLGDWISKIFCSYENATIDETAFVTQHLSLFPGIDYSVAKKRWKALVNTQRGEAKNRYEVSDLLRGLLRNARDPVLYQSNNEKQYAITVSNIHRAKGKEFDSVIVIDDVIEAMTKPEDDDILEHKVCYVALTRPKKQIERAELTNREKQIYITRNADQSARCSKAGGRGKRYLSHFEVGHSTDMDVRSFAVSEKIQQFIKSDIYPGMRLKLIKCPQDTNAYVTYRLVVEDSEKTVLGHTSKAFATELEKAIQHIYNNMTNPIWFKVFPNTFCDIYVDNVATHISSMPAVPVGAKAYGDIGIWAGVTITGFATFDKDTH